MASRHRRTYSAGPRDDRGVGGGWGGDHAGLHLCGHPPPLILRRAQHERPCPARGFRIGVGNDGREGYGFQPGSGNGGSKRQVNGVDPSRGLGMTGGGGWEAITWYCSYVGPPAHTSRASARAAPPLGMASRHRRTYSAGPRDDRGVGGGWGGNHAGLHLCGHPPAHTSRASARAALPVGMASRHRRTYSAGPRDDRGVGGGGGGNHAGLNQRGHPRSYFDGLSTSGPAVGEGDHESRHCGGRMGQERKEGPGGDILWAGTGERRVGVKWREDDGGLQGYLIGQSHRRAA